MQKSRETWWKCVLEGDPERFAARERGGFRV